MVKVNDCRPRRQLKLGNIEPIALFEFCAPVLRETGAGKSAIPQRMFEFPWEHAGLFSGGGKKPLFYPISAKKALDAGIGCGV